MQLVVQGRHYDLKETLSKPSLNDLYYLKVKTISAEFPKGVSLKTMVPVMEKMATFEDPTDIIDDAELLLNLRALVFLCRKHAGENVTLDTANDFPLDEFSFEMEDSDTVQLEAAKAGPTQAPPASGRGVEQLEVDPAPIESPTT